MSFYFIHLVDLVIIFSDHIDYEKMAVIWYIQTRQGAGDKMFRFEDYYPCDF